MQMRQLSTRVLQMNPPFCKTHSFLYISLPSLHDYKQRENAWFHVLWRTWTQDNGFLFPCLTFDTEFKHLTPTFYELNDME